MFFGALGPVAVWTASGEPVPVPGRKVRALLAVLLVHEGRPVPAARLIDDLWGENLPGNPAGSLSGKASQLRRVLAEAEAGGGRLVVSPPPGYRLRVDTGVVDVGRFRSLTAQARTVTDVRSKARLLADALAWWRGPAFADFADEPFASAAAARLAEERLVAIEEYAQARLALGGHPELVAELGELVAAHPLRERLRAAHMRALYRAARPSEALDSYEELRVRLADELGLDPGPELVALHRRVLARDPSLDAPAPPTRPRTNLPAPVSELIGRDDAVAEVGARLKTARLVTLTGPGGVGKTRLALEAAGHQVDAQPDGVWLAELAALEPKSSGGPAAVVSAVLDVRDVSGTAQSLEDRLVDAVRNKRLLLVLDNCEHVVEQVADLVGRLLRAAAGLRVLATSREPLGLTGEVVWTVAPLEVPDPAEATMPARLVGWPAVRLFVDRAAAADPEFVLDDATAPAVAVLCRGLDGIPLALELAAARVRALGVDELVVRLDDRFRLLAAGRRDAPARQQTLIATIDWSWNLLAEPERVVLRRLAVHADSCSLEAAERVCAGDGLDVADLLARLVDRSLVSIVRDADGTRYRLLESVAAYCADRLADSGETQRIRERHATYYTALALHADEQLRGPDQRRWLRRLDADTANIRVVLDDAIRSGNGDRALQLARAMNWYWFLRGRLTEARCSLRMALAADGRSSTARRATAAVWEAAMTRLLGEHPDPANAHLLEHPDDSAERGRAEWFLAYAETDFGDISAVDQRLDRAMGVFRAADDPWGVAAVLSTRCKLGYVRGDFTALRHDGERSAEQFRRLGDRWGLMQATAWLGGLAEMVGDYPKANRLHHEGLRIAQELGLCTEVCVRLAWLAWIAVSQCDYPRAVELSDRARQLAVEQGFRVGQTFAEIGLAFAARRQGHHDDAEIRLAALLPAGWEARDDQPPPLHLSLVLTELGFLAERRGQPDKAKQLHLAALRASRILGQPRAVALALEGLAGASILAGDHEMSARLLGAADAARHVATVPASPSERTEIDRITALARRAVDDTEFNNAYQHGAGLPQDALADLLSLLT